MKVSIIIPVYNAAEYLAEAVHSALAQPETAEVILVDDASTDNSLAVARELALSDNRIKVLTHENGQNKGSAETRNVGIRAASCEYIAFIDADDWFLPNRFAHAKQLFEQYPDADGVYEAVENVFTEKAKSFSKTVSLGSALPIHMVRKQVSPGNLLGLLIDDPIGIIMLQGLCIKRKLFDKTGLFDPSFRVAEDMLLVKKMAAVGNLYAGDLHKPVSARRVHDSNITFSAFKDTDKTKHLEGEMLLEWALKMNVEKRYLEKIFVFRYRLYMYSQTGSFNNPRARRKYLLDIIMKYPRVSTFREFWKLMPVIGRFL